MNNQNRDNSFYFGTLPDGREVRGYTISNTDGLRVTILDYGAVIQSIQLPLGEELTDIALGFDTVEHYIKSHSLPAPPYFGAVAGRYSGRIKHGRFTLNGNEYQLVTNNNGHTLHGGKEGFDQKVWNLESLSQSSVTLSYRSSDGDQNFPAELYVEVKYSLTEHNDLQIEYGATASGDTIVNMTQHTYFNLDGHDGNVLSQQLQLASDTLIEVDGDLIPTGKFVPASTKDFDFKQARTCPTTIDDSFVINDNTSPAAILTSKKTGLQLQVFSDQPSLHIYVGGDCFDEIPGKSGVKYHEHSGICFESQHLPDSPNHPHFPSTVLRKGDSYRQQTVWKFRNIKIKSDETH